jgi:hypothetical protein
VKEPGDELRFEFAAAVAAGTFFPSEVKEPGDELRSSSRQQFHYSCRHTTFFRRDVLLDFLNVIFVNVNSQDCLRISSSWRLGTIIFGLVGIVIDVE